jgi:hypothetical protein
MYRLHRQGDKNQRTRNNVRSSVLRYLVIANVPCLPILVTLMVEAILAAETSVLTRTTRRHIPKTAFFVVFLTSLCATPRDITRMATSRNYTKRQKLYTRPTSQVTRTDYERFYKHFYVARKTQNTTQ